MLQDEISRDYAEMAQEMLKEYGIPLRCFKTEIRMLVAGFKKRDSNSAYSPSFLNIFVSSVRKYV
jgi:hypothetical protein